MKDHSEIDPETGRAYSAATWEFLREAVRQGWTVKMALFGSDGCEEWLKEGQRLVGESVRSRRPRINTPVRIAQDAGYCGA